jgi:hypothetical protein
MCKKTKFHAWAPSKEALFNDTLDEALLYSQLSVPLKACCRREVVERRGAEDLHLLATDKITKEFFNLRLPVNTEVFIQANLQQCTASLVRMYKEAILACVPSKPEQTFSAGE